MAVLLPRDRSARWARRESKDGSSLTRRHPEWPLSARYRAGLLHPSRLCPPRDHPPSGSIGPCLVIRPKADLALVAHDPDPAQIVPRLLLPGEWVPGEWLVSFLPRLATRMPPRDGGKPGEITDRRRRPCKAVAETVKTLAYFGDADGLVLAVSTRSSLVTSRTPAALRATCSAAILSSTVGTFP